MSIPCNQPYAKLKPDWAWLAIRLGLDQRTLRNRVHKRKAAYGLRGAEAIVICLDNGLVYAAASCDEIGDIHTH